MEGSVSHLEQSRGLCVGRAGEMQKLCQPLHGLRRQPVSGRGGGGRGFLGQLRGRELRDENMQGNRHLACQRENLEGEQVEVRLVVGDDTQQIAHRPGDVQRGHEERQWLGDQDCFENQQSTKGKETPLPLS